MYLRDHLFSFTIRLRARIAHWALAVGYSVCAQSAHLSISLSRRYPISFLSFGSAVLGAVSPSSSSS